MASLEGCWIHFNTPRILCANLTKDSSWPVFSPLQSKSGFPLSLPISAKELSSFCQGLFKIALWLHLQPTDYCCVLLVSFCFYHKDRIIKTQLKQQQYYKNLKIQAPLSLMCTNIFINENRFQNNSAHFHLIAGKWGLLVCRCVCSEVSFYGKDNTIF